MVFREVSVIEIREALRAWLSAQDQPPGAGAGAAAERSRASSSQVLLAQPEDHMRLRSRLQRSDRARNVPGRLTGTAAA